MKTNLMKKILLLCALFAFVTANVAMAQNVTKSYEDYKKYKQGNESYEQYQKRLDGHARANRIGGLMERLNKATNGKIEEFANGKKPGNKTVKINPVATPEAVDLGLPSGTLWASMNLGANVPTEVGNYYAGGEAQPKAQFTLENYKFYDKATDNIKDYPGNVAGTEFDPAFVALGNHWQMPNRVQSEELLTNCNCVREEVNGVNCFRFVGPNGNSILIPFNNTIIYHQEIKPEDDMFIRWSDLIDVPFLVQGVPVRPVNVDPSLMAESKRKTAEREEAIRKQKIEDEINEVSVDLGLSVRWAKCNYMANTPTQIGTYLEKPYYFRGEKKLPLSGLTSEMPSGAELKELAEKCTWTETTESGVSGYKVTGPNGNSIFIPCGGNKGGVSLTQMKSEITDGCYLVADQDGIGGQRILVAKKGKVKLSWGLHGYNVRPVYK